MRKISTIEGISVMYIVYFFITLFFTPNLFSAEKSDLYQALQRVFPMQDMWEITSMILIVLYVISFFINHYVSEMIINAIGGSFFMLVSVTYLFTYPNIGAGIFLFVSIYCFRQVYRANNRHEFQKVSKLKHDLSNVEDGEFKKYKNGE
ncbi:hypothetical protein QI033_00620 [Staphylococcus saprophyticus]|nr:hypothetical protein [Staphylococcus saprophyticus]